MQRLTIPMCLTFAPLLAAAEIPFGTHEIDKSLGVGYAVHFADMNRDRKPDILVVDQRRLVWFENPSWKKRVVAEGLTKPDNVSAAVWDIDGDGRQDIALAADWRPMDTKKGGTIQWLRQGKKPDDPWTIHPIAEEPTVHRIRWVDLAGDGKPELVVVPLMGRNSAGPNWNQAPLRVLSFAIPSDPARDRWPPTVLNETLHVAHNFVPCDLDDDGRRGLLLASFEGLSWLKPAGDKWSLRLVHEANQDSRPNRGASEVKVGRRADGSLVIATIEPWHGFQVVVYERKDQAGPWTRVVLDEDLRWGHAVAFANLDADGDDELIIGVRDTKSPASPCGVRIYDPEPGKTLGKWESQRIDPAGVAVEDLVVGDLNGDAQVDIVAVGRQTKNVRLYLNRRGAR